MESSAGPSSVPELRVRMLGPFSVSRGGRPLALPASRKLRALLAYLALAPRPAGRSQLCELLWDRPDDPRGELRWYLSKLRSVLDTPTRQRVLAADDRVALDLTDCAVDAIEVQRATVTGTDGLTAARRRELAAMFQGDFLEGLELDRNPSFSSWLTAQRRRFRGCQAALLEQLSLTETGDEALGYLEKWLQLAPFDRRAQVLLLERLAQRGRLREGEEHLASAVALFEAEGLDHGPLRAAWHALRSPAVSLANTPEEPAPAAQRRASIAVMPFNDATAPPGERGGAADALAHDVTTGLAKLRSMFVIAQGSSFALHERRIGPEEAGRMLNVDYVLSGDLRRRGGRLSLNVELVETRSARIVWSEVLNQPLDEAFRVLEDIGNRVVASIASEIETLERNRAILRPPNSLDAWGSHHRGLWHMYRFTRADNERAQHFFSEAVRLDPSFARAHAGLSFTHFQDAFLGWKPGAEAMDSAFETAGQSLMVDDRDPAAHWAMGRALWLRGSNDQARLELERSIDLSPNFALAHYMLAFVQSQAGDPAAAIAAADCSRELSPFDPLLFGMMGARAMALARMGRHEEAADWALKAASRPNAHAHIFAIAACCLALAGSLDEARKRLAAIRKTLPHYGIADFLGAFRFDAEAAALFRKAGKRIGLA